MNPETQSWNPEPQLQNRELSLDAKLCGRRRSHPPCVGFAAAVVRKLLLFKKQAGRSSSPPNLLSEAFKNLFEKWSQNVRFEHFLAEVA